MMIKKINGKTLNYCIIVNKIYLYNYGDKITFMIMSSKLKLLYKKYRKSILHKEIKNI